jgi:hypothetical protein
VDIAHARLHNQRLLSAGLQTATDVVRWFGAVQAQDYQGAKWALGQRMQSATDVALEHALAVGSILRTHVMRPTWHFVSPEDIRWMLALTAPRVNARLRSRHRELELDDQVFRRANRTLASALRSGRHLTRASLREALSRRGIAPEGQRLAHILMRAEMDGVICSGPRVGKQFTYALLEERVPQETRLTREEAIAELTKRYFTSHGPARVRDFTWWSGLTAADATAGLAMARPRLVESVVDGTAYWSPASMPPAQHPPATAFLLPAFDEYLVAYTGREATLDPAIVVEGRVVGRWKRTLTRASAVVALMPFAPLSRAQRRAVGEAAERYAAFTGAGSEAFSTSFVPQP